MAQAAVEANIRYNMNVDVDYERAFINVTQAVRYTNTSGVPLSSLVFNVPPLAFNGFTLSTASMGETPLTTTQAGTQLEIVLPSPVAPGDYALVTLRWWGQLPASNGRYGAAEGVLILGDWYPMLAVQRNGMWEKHQYTTIGDAFFSEAADYSVSVTVPPTVTVAASGRQVSRNGSTWSFQAQGARDFAMGVSSRFQTVSGSVDATTITVYYLPDSSEAAKASLDIAEQAMRWYNQKIGPYPFAALSIVQSPLAGQHNAQEHAGLFFLRSDTFVPGVVGVYAAHELAHAWFFAAVGNDQIRQPWMDEGLVTSVSLDFYKEQHPDEYSGLWGSWGGTPDIFTSTLPMNRGIGDFDNGSVYFFTVYRQGATFLRAVRDAIGDEAYWKALQTYYKQYSGAIAEPRDLLRVLQAAAPNVDLLPIFRTYLDYPFLKYTNLALDIGGAEGQVWEGKAAAPVTVSADSPTVTLAVTLDARPVITYTGAPTVTSFSVDTASLAHGKHEIVATVEDIGLNRTQMRRSFQVYRPTSTPEPTATHTPRPSPTPPPTATKVPTIVATALPSPAPQVATGRSYGTTWAVVSGAGLAGAGLIVAAIWLRRRSG